MRDLFRLSVSRLQQSPSELNHAFNGTRRYDCRVCADFLHSKLFPRRTTRWYVNSHMENCATLDFSQFFRTNAISSSGQSACPASTRSRSIVGRVVIAAISCAAGVNELFLSLSPNHALN